MHGRRYRNHVPATFFTAGAGTIIQEPLVANGKSAEFKVDIVMMGIRNWFASSLVGITDLCLAEGSWMGEPRFTKLHQRWC